jgi:hypothetical protein
LAVADGAPSPQKRISVVLSFIAGKLARETALTVSTTATAEYGGGATELGSVTLIFLEPVLSRIISCGPPVADFETGVSTECSVRVDADEAGAAGYNVALKHQLGAGLTASALSCKEGCEGHSASLLPSGDVSLGILVLLPGMATAWSWTLTAQPVVDVPPSSFLEADLIGEYYSAPTLSQGVQEMIYSFETNEATYATKAISVKSFRVSYSSIEGTTGSFVTVGEELDFEVTITVPLVAVSDLVIEVTPDTTSLDMTVARVEAAPNGMTILGAADQSISTNGKMRVDTLTVTDDAFRDLKFTFEGLVDSALGLDGASFKIEGKVKYGSTELTLILLC